MNDQKETDSEKQGMFYRCESHKCRNQRRFFKVSAERGDVLLIQCKTCGWRKEVANRTSMASVQKSLGSKRRVTAPRPILLVEYVPTEPSIVVSVGDMRELFERVDEVFGKRRISANHLQRWENIQNELKRAAVTGFGMMDILFEELPDSISLNAHGVFLMARALDWLSENIVGFKK